MKNQKVYSVNGNLQAMLVRSVLECAGIKSQMSPSSDGAYLDVYVRADCVFDAENILNPKHAFDANGFIPASL